jgi:hypothetical protein
MSAAGDGSSVTIRKPAAVLWVSVFFALPFVALAVFVPRFRIFGIIFALLTTIPLARQVLSVRVTHSEVVLQAPTRSERYSLSEIKHVEFADVAGGFGATTPSIRLDFHDRPSVQLSGFLIDRTDALYKVILAAWQRVHSTPPT